MWWWRKTFNASLDLHQETKTGNNNKGLQRTYHNATQFDHVVLAVGTWKEGQETTKKETRQKKKINEKVGSAMRWKGKGTCSERKSQFTKECLTKGNSANGNKERVGEPSGELLKIKSLKERGRLSIAYLSYRHLQTRPTRRLVHRFLAVMWSQETRQKKEKKYTIDYNASKIRGEKNVRKEAGLVSHPQANLRQAKDRLKAPTYLQ